MREWKFYKEPFDLTRPPPAPPNKTVKHTLFFGSPHVEIRESIERGVEWHDRLEEYGQKLSARKKPSSDERSLPENCSVVTVPPGGFLLLIPKHRIDADSLNRLQCSLNDWKDKNNVMVPVMVIGDNFKVAACGVDPKASD